MTMKLHESPAALATMTVMDGRRVVACARRVRSGRWQVKAYAMRWLDVRAHMKSPVTGSRNPQFIALDSKAETRRFLSDLVQFKQADY